MRWKIHGVRTGMVEQQQQVEETGDKWKQWATSAAVTEAFTVFAQGVLSCRQVSLIFKMTKDIKSVEPQKKKKENKATNFICFVVY